MTLLSLQNSTKSTSQSKLSLFYKIISYCFWLSAAKFSASYFSLLSWTFYIFISTYNFTIIRTTYILIQILSLSQAFLFQFPDLSTIALSFVLFPIVVFPSHRKSCVLDSSKLIIVWPQQHSKRWS